MKEMKLFILFTSLVWLAACSNSNTPEDVAGNFNIAIYKADFEGAKALCTKESKQAVDFIAAFTAERVTDMRKADVRYITQKVTVSEDGNSADVEGLILGAIDLQKGEVIDSTQTMLHLVKQQDKWLVDYKLK